MSDQCNNLKQILVNDKFSFTPFTQTQRMLAALNGGLLPGMNGGMMAGWNGGIANGAIPGMMAGGLNRPMVAAGGAGLFGQPQFPQVSLSDYLNSTRGKIEFNSCKII